MAVGVAVEVAAELTAVETDMALPVGDGVDSDDDVRDETPPSLPDESSVGESSTTNVCGKMPTLPFSSPFHQPLADFENTVRCNEIVTTSRCVSERERETMKNTNTSSAARAHEFFCFHR